jgi:hypothetical protein
MRAYWGSRYSMSASRGLVRSVEIKPLRALCVCGSTRARDLAGSSSSIGSASDEVGGRRRARLVSIPWLSPVS